MAIEGSNRLHHLRQSLALNQGQGFLVTHLPDIRWVSGFTGSNACLMVSPDRALLITDGRYTEQARLECGDLPVHIVSASLTDGIVQIATEWGLEQMCLQGQHVSWAEVSGLQTKLKRVVVEDGPDPLAHLRSVKDESELSAIKKALAMTEEVFEEILDVFEEGLTELDIAAEIDYRHRQKGASGAAFDTIVAFSENAALPHARPGSRSLRRGDIILMDFGGVVDGYHSDMTRTVVFGRSDKDFLEAYEAVRSALLKATERAAAGMTGEQLDGVARQVLTEHGYGSAFSHSLGHGVGLEIHESPSVSRRNVLPLPEGCIITIEPGVYLPGHFGVRIENMVQLQSGGCSTLNRLGTDLVRL